MTEQSAIQTNLVNLTIDGRAVSVPKGTTVYNAARHHGIEVPIFCYHDRMPPFGACRVCLVEVEKMPKLQTSCTLEATEGMVVRTTSDAAEDGRKSILEFLLINHPLDCPICDRGGECPLQDNVLRYGPGESRFFEEKRRFRKPIPLGPVLMLDRERCIVCARCTRFGDGVAGDHALELLDRGYKSEVGTPGGGTAESKFIGNTIMICPVGALTSRVYRFRARPWDNKPTHTTCTLCPVGCSMILDSRDGEIMRTRSCENKQINDIWLCDKGWFGYEFVTNPERLSQPLIRKNGILEAASWDEALTLIASKISESKGNGKIAAIGGNPLTVEENYLFQKLMRDSIKTNNIDHRIGVPILTESQESVQPGMELTIGDSTELSFAILLGLDLTEEFPVIWLRLKQAINKGATVLFLGHFAPEIAPHLSKTIIHSPGKELDLLNEYIPYFSILAGRGKSGAVFVGRQYLNTPKRSEILSQLLKFRKASPNTTLNVMEGCENSVGARYAGMRPDFGPYGEKLSQPGLNAPQVIEEAAKNGWDVLYVAGANPAVKVPASQWNEARSKLGFLVVQDLFLNETAAQADVVLPTLSYTEKGGTFINIDGHIQKLHPGKYIPDTLYTDGDIFTLLAEKLNTPISLDNNFLESLKAERFPYQLPSEFITEKPKDEQHLQEDDLFASFAPALFDHGVRMKHNTRLVQMAKEPAIRIHPSEGEKRGLKNGDNVTVTANDNQIAGTVKFDAKVASKTAVLPLGFPEFPVHNLGLNLINGMAIKLRKISETETKLS